MLVENTLNILFYQTEQLWSCTVILCPKIKFTFTYILLSFTDILCPKNKSTFAYKKIHTTASVLKKSDYYEVLGLSRNCSAKDIKKSYFELAKKYHPDTNKNDPNAVKKFQEVSEAYEVSLNSKHFWIRLFMKKMKCVEFIKLYHN